MKMAPMSGGRYTGKGTSMMGTRRAVDVSYRGRCVVGCR